MRKLTTSENPIVVEEASTADLVREALEDAKELVRVEVAFATSEIEAQVTRAKVAAIGIGVACGALLLVLCMLAVALVLALGGTPTVALLVAAAWVVVGGVAAAIGYALMPKKPLERTRERLKNDVGQLKERIA